MRYASVRNARAVRLERGWASRLRLDGALETNSWLAILCYGMLIRLSAQDHLLGDVVTVALVGAPLLVVGVAIRVAVATEYVEADTWGVRWRGLFRSDAIRWEHIDSFDIARIHLFSLHRWQSRDVLQLTNRNGTTRRLRASVGCSAAWPEFIAGAQALRDARPSPAVDLDTDEAG